MDETCVPCFAKGARFRHDNVRGQWIVLAPERVLLPDATAVEILRRIDGAASLSRIIDELAIVFAAPRALIAADVMIMVDDLLRAGILRDAAGDAPPENRQASPA